MRILLVVIILMSSLFLQAQTSKQSLEDSSYSIHKTQNKKWVLTPYSNIGIGFNFVNGNTATVVSAPVGLQLTRQLNNNFYAFTSVSVAPVYTNFNRAFLSPVPGMGKSYPGNNFKSSYFDLYSSVNMGLMYINDARTFSVSGSLGVSRGTNPAFLYPPVNMYRANTFAPVPVYK